MFGNPFRKYQKKLAKLYRNSGTLESILEKVEPETKRYQKTNQELISLTHDIDEFIEERYALAVFEHYEKSQPDLIDNTTEKTVSWGDVFSNDYEKISKNLRHALVGLVEGYGQYRIK